MTGRDSFGGFEPLKIMPMVLCVLCVKIAHGTIHTRSWLDFEMNLVFRVV